MERHENRITLATGLRLDRLRGREQEPGVWAGAAAAVKLVRTDDRGVAQRHGSGIIKE